MTVYGTKSGKSIINEKMKELYLEQGKTVITYVDGVSFAMGFDTAKDITPTEDRQNDPTST